MKILIVSKCPTHPTNAGNRRWTLSQCEILEQLGHVVHFLYIAEFPLEKARLPLFKNDLDETSLFWRDRFHLYKLSKFSHLRNILVTYRREWFNKGFYHCDDKYPKGLTSFVRKLQQKENFDVCILNYYELSKIAEKISFPKVAINTHDCFSYKNLVINKKYAGQLTASEEAKAMQRCRSIFALQEEEAIFFQKLSPKSIVYTLFSYTEYRPSEVVNNYNILFLSGSNQFNINGLNWFVNDVFPLIQKEFPQAELLVGGAICSVVSYSNKHIKLLGSINNASEFYSMGDVAINPVYQGTGIKVKTIESIAYDKVTIAHPHSKIGIFKSETAPLFVSEEPIEWLNFLKTIWRDKSAIERIKVKNKDYLFKMNNYIVQNYKLFLEQ